MKYRIEEWAVACAIMIAVAFVAMTCNGCTSAEMQGARDTLRPVVLTACQLAEKFAEYVCPSARAIVGEAPATSGGEDEEPSSP